jgi:isoamylase
VENLSSDPNVSGLSTVPGKPLPLGAVPMQGGVQFAMFTRNGTGVTLLLFDRPDDLQPAAEVELDPAHNTTGNIWHVFVHGVTAGQLYLYRVYGPWDPRNGHRFDDTRYLIDPYAKALTDGGSRDVHRPEGMPKCVVVDGGFDWQGDRPLNYPLRKSIIYETHVKGLTAHPSSEVTKPGTFAGVIEKIPYFRDLGVTSLEFLPIQEFDYREPMRQNPETGEELTNYWGYNPIAFFAPAAVYSSAGTMGEQVVEFKTMVRELHKAGIEVILDVVFNHTAEGDERGPTITFRGLDNRIYYILGKDRRTYRNFSGCGNTLNCNHPIMRTLILDCLRYWVMDMHVDGFRFDLGSILGRDGEGHLLENPPIVERIAEDPVLRHTKIIAEAWDAAGAYQVGWFPGGRWAEWNDRFRDDVRMFWRGETGVVGKLAMRMTGSSDLYLRDGRKPFHSINFITSHDGFTLNDLVSYARKHNRANGEENRDGSEYNLSDNYGVEGPTVDSELDTLRTRQLKNFLATLLLSIGTPMLLGGDEFRRTQQGNNNAYCQDNEVSWYDWTHLRTYADLYRFTRELIDFRKRHPAFSRPEFYAGADSDYNGLPDITWYSADGEEMDWSTAEYFLAMRIDGSRAEIRADRDDNDFYILINSGEEDVRCRIGPAPAGKRWCRKIDTALPSPDDILHSGMSEPIETEESYVAAGRSFVLFVSV